MTSDFLRQPRLVYLLINYGFVGQFFFEPSSQYVSFAAQNGESSCSRQKRDALHVGIGTSWWRWRSATTSRTGTRWPALGATWPVFGLQPLIPESSSSPREHGLGTFNSLVGSQDLIIYPSVDDIFGNSRGHPVKWKGQLECREQKAPTNESLKME
jgi:hypothetical protein